MSAFITRTLELTCSQPDCWETLDVYPVCNLDEAIGQAKSAGWTIDADSVDDFRSRGPVHCYCPDHAEEADRE